MLAAHDSLTPAESAHPENSRVTPLQSALPKTLTLKSFRIRTSKLRRGEGCKLLTSPPLQAAVRTFHPRAASLATPPHLTQPFSLPHCFLASSLRLFEPAQHPLRSFVPTPDVLVSPCGNSAPATCDASPRAVSDFSLGFQFAPPVPEVPFRETAIAWAQFTAVLSLGNVGRPDLHRVPDLNRVEVAPIQK